ncbi:hypothetical protein [Paractinoplanes lichenicola]|uniref:Uncharacterized protein n=1 Tax=Paractinoplanes lichenicola TaxID=2802976 RepID=A0ABS1VHF1_9ACTN|nr:hypothetical protein [Actinoplanes lichenicola]MBL7254075.1 hypothetical protein [Actinoplanes lichenicola]
MSIDAVRRRGAGFIVAAVVLVVAAGLAVWLWPRETDPRTAATEAALDRALDIGGPQGWTSTEPVSMLPQDGQTGETESRDGVLIGINRDSGAFTATWTTTMTPEACDALAAWAVRVVPSTPPDDTRSNCRDSREGAGIFAGAGTEPDANGRQMFYATADENSMLTVSLAYKAPADAAAG